MNARAPELLAELSDTYVAELQRCVVETNSGVVDTLDGLLADLQRHRRLLVDTATGLGMGVVAAGAVPLSVPASPRRMATAKGRRRIRHRFITVHCRAESASSSRTRIRSVGGERDIPRST